MLHQRYDLFDLTDHQNQSDGIQKTGKHGRWDKSRQTLQPHAVKHGLKQGCNDAHRYHQRQPH